MHSTPIEQMRILSMFFEKKCNTWNAKVAPVDGIIYIQDVNLYGPSVKC